MNASVVKNEAEKEVATMKMYIVKTKIGTEDKVIADMTARLEGAGSMKEKKAHIGKMINPAHLKGYLFVEAIDEHYLEAVLGLTGNALRIKNVSSIVGEGQDPVEDVKPIFEGQKPVSEHLRPRKGSDNLEVGMMVQITKGAWKGEQAIITNINARDDTLTLEIWGHVPIPIYGWDATEVRRV